MALRCLPTPTQKQEDEFLCHAALPGFVSAGVVQQSQPDDVPAAANNKVSAMPANPEEMELDEVDEAAEMQEGAQQVQEEEEQILLGAGGEVQLQQKAVPAAVFGGVRESEDGSDAAQPPPALGALDRFKKRKTQS